MSKRKNHGYILASGLLLLFLATWFSLSAWNMGILFHKAEVNFEQQGFTQKAAFAALDQAEDKMVHELNTWAVTAKDLSEIKSRISLLGSSIEPQTEAQKEAVVSPRGLDRHSSQPMRFDAQFLSGSLRAQTHAVPTLYVRVTILSGRKGRERQELTVFYALYQKADGVLAMERRAMYIF